MINELIILSLACAWDKVDTAPSNLIRGSHGITHLETRLGFHRY